MAGQLRSMRAAKHTSSVKTGGDSAWAWRLAAMRQAITDAFASTPSAQPLRCNCSKASGDWRGGYCDALTCRAMSRHASSAFAIK
jgi:hypothetical protein